MNMGRGCSPDGPEISRDRMTAECELSVNGVIIGRGGLKRGRQERLAGVPVLMTATGDMFSACDKIATRLVRRGTQTGPYGSSMPRASRLGFRTPSFGRPDGQVDETSTVPDQFAHLKQIGKPARCDLPGLAELPAGASETPQRGPHLRRRTQAPVRLRPPRRHAESAARCARAMPAAGINADVLPFPGLRELFRGRGGSCVFGSVKRVTVMHVHHG